MKIAVFYGTVEGHTRKIAGTIAAQLEEMGHQAMLVDVSQPGPTGVGEMDAAILAAPIHVGQYPPAFVSFIQNWKSQLADLPTALVTVSLGIASKIRVEREEAESFPEGLFEQTGWRANRVHNAAGALKYVEYDFFKRWMMRRISEMEGGPVDTSKDHELTNWDQLKEFVSNFVLEVDMVQ